MGVHSIGPSKSSRIRSPPSSPKVACISSSKTVPGVPLNWEASLPTRPSEPAGSNTWSATSRTGRFSPSGIAAMHKLPLRVAKLAQ